MNAKCHNCGREYITARAMAGTAIPCRSCRALNDGAGGPTPPQTNASSRTGGEQGRASSEKPLAGESFTVGEKVRRVDPRELAAAEARAEVLASAAAAGRSDGARMGASNRAVTALGYGAALLSVVMIGGLFLLRKLQSPSTTSRDWTTTQLAVPQIVFANGTGTGFIIEDKDQLWLITSYQHIQGARDASLLFRAPADGTVLFTLPGLRIADFRVHNDFLKTIDNSDDGRIFDIAAISVELYRPQLESIGVIPLQIAKVVDVRSGTRVVALGHADTAAFNLGSKDDDGSAGVALHSIFDGVISGIRADQGKPTLVQTSANFTNGCQGGPLVLEESGEVVGIDRWGEVDKNGSIVAGMHFAIAAEHALDVVKTGLTLGTVGKRLTETVAEASQTPLEGKYEEEAWETFDQLSDLVSELNKNDWTMVSNAVHMTSKDGSFSWSHSVQGPNATEVAVLALPRAQVVDVDIGTLSIGGFTGIGSDLDGVHGALAAVGIEDPRSGDLLSLAAGVQITIPIQSYFLGKPIAARFVLVILERPAGARSSAQASAQASAPPSPPTPPSSPPSTPPSTPPAAAPPQNPPPKAPPPEQGGMASVAEVHDGMEKAVFASSLISFRNFDSTFLTNRADAFAALESAFVDVPGFSLKDDPQFFSSIMWASLCSSMYGGASGEAALLSSRPLFKVKISNAPENARVGVYIEVDAASRKYLPLSVDGLVSSQSDIELVHSIPANLGSYDADGEAFTIPFDLPWNTDELKKLESAVEIPYTLRLKYSDGTQDSLAGRIRVNPPAEIERAYPFELGFAAAVDETHPWVKRILDGINQDPEVVKEGLSLSGGGAGSDDGALISIYLIWRELAMRGMRYQNLTAAAVGAQRCRLVHESISSANANCVDGTVLLASFFEAIGAKACIVLVPGHAFICVDLKDRRVFIETTVISERLREDPQTRSDELFASIRRSPFFLRDQMFNAFEAACEAGVSNMDEAVTTAEPVLAEFRRLIQLGDRRTEQENQELAVCCDNLAQQVKVVPISRARKHGIIPIGVPSNLDAKFRIPPRKSK